MRLLIQTLTICLALSYGLAAPSHHGEHHASDAPGKDHSHDHSNDHHTHLDRCKHNEFDAVAVNAEGIPYFFKGEYLFKGFFGKAELINKTFPELDHHLLMHRDSVFRMPPEDSLDHHEHMYFFLDDKVFNYDNHTLVKDFPKPISEVFPGIPDHIDSSVECHKPDCLTNSIIFFKGKKIFHFDIESKKVDEKEFQSMPNCTSAFYFMGHYYCVHGHKLSKFDPKTGETHGKFPKEIRDYFMKCDNFGDKTEKEHIEREQCSHVHLDAITEEDDGDMIAFRGHYYLSKIGGKFHAGTIESAFKGLHSDVDAVFSHDDHLHIIKDDKVFAYKVSHKPGEPNTALDGYPKSLKEDLGMEGHIDATFHCSKDNIVHVIKDHTVYDVDLSATPRAIVKQFPIPHFKKIDTVMCGTKGVTVVIGDHFYRYASPAEMITARIKPAEHDLSHELLGCHDNENHHS